MEQELPGECLPGLSHQLQQPRCSPGSFFVQPGHAPCCPLKSYFSVRILIGSPFISPWPSLRDPARSELQWTLQQQQWGAVPGPELPPGSPASCGQLDASALIFPQGKVGLFLPSPLPVSISCFHFQWLGILGVGKGGLKHVSGVIYASAFGLLCLFCCSFEIKEYSSR